MVYKKAISILLTGVLLLTLSACSVNTTNALNLPKYISKECHYSNGFQDYTKYCKYYYDKETIKHFEANSKFIKITESDLENVRSYFENFENWVSQEDYYDKYDFDYFTQIGAGDYIYIFTKEGYDIFGYYDIYYVDIQNCIVYFIHQNI